MITLRFCQHEQKSVHFPSSHYTILIVDRILEQQQNCWTIQTTMCSNWTVQTDYQRHKRFNLTIRNENQQWEKGKSLIENLFDIPLPPKGPIFVSKRNQRFSITMTINLNKKIQAQIEKFTKPNTSYQILPTPTPTSLHNTQKSFSPKWPNKQKAKAKITPNPYDNKS